MSFMVVLATVVNVYFFENSNYCTCFTDIYTSYHLLGESFPHVWTVRWPYSPLSSIYQFDYPSSLLILDLLFSNTKHRLLHRTHSIESHLPLLHENHLAVGYTCRAHLSPSRVSCKPILSGCCPSIDCEPSALILLVGGESFQGSAHALT